MDLVHFNVSCRLLNLYILQILIGSWYELHFKFLLGLLENLSVKMFQSLDICRDINP